MMTQWQALRDRLAGKWQVPVFLLSMVMLAASFHRLSPNPASLPPEKAIDELRSLVSSAAYGSAIALADAILDRDDLTDANSGPAHLWSARARYLEAQSRGVSRADIGRRIVEHYEHAASFSEPLTGEDERRLGRALEWQEKFRSAAAHYEKALAAGVEEDWELRQHLVSLRLEKLDEPDERVDERLDEFLAAVGAGLPLSHRRLELVLWAIERKLDLYQRLGRLEEATTLLLRNRERFEGSDLHDRFGYLEGWLLYATGHFDEAETHLRTVRNRVEQDDPVYAMTGWLLGRVVSEDGGPQRPLEALSFFNDVVANHPNSAYAVASRIGAGDALAMLERHAEALDAYSIATIEMESQPVRRLESAGLPVDRATLRASLAVLAETQRQADKLPEAVAYARLATTLLDPKDVDSATLLLQQLAVLQSLLAVDLDDQAGGGGRVPGRETRSVALPRASSQEARAAFADAAETYHRLAQINALHERRAAEASWRAADLFTRAGEIDLAGALYVSFAAERPQHSLVPRALLRIGILHQAVGRLPAAVDAYRECYRRFPRTLDAARSLVPLARCYLSMGPDYEDLAEKTLRVVLEDSEVFTPQAPEFANAMLLLGEVLNRRGDFERAIPTLEEMLERYPKDPRVWEAHFLLADSYRRSGLALKAEIADAKFAEEIQQMRTDAAARFAAAQKLYRRLIDEYELRDPTTFTGIQRVRLRLSFLYEADCYFERQDHRQALKLYEQAAALYKDTASALAAYVQIINSHVFLGRPAEARAALARALVLVDALPEAAFVATVSREGRSDWKRYFEWLGKSELF